MMLFDEFYGSYYRAVAEILKKALKKPVTQADMIALCDKYSFGQARMVIPAELSKRVWPLLKEVPDSKPKAWKPVIHNVPRTPLTTLELRWLKAISLDPRIRLFDVKLDFLKDVEPLFRPEDIICFDCYADGDDYADENYQQVFRTLLTAVQEHRRVEMEYVSRREKSNTDVVTPLRLEYSEKDDRFRVLCAAGQDVRVRNLEGIRSCKLGEVTEDPLPDPDERKTKTVLLEIRDFRNTMERVSLHFTHLRKEVERVDPATYRMKLWYDATDEPEMVIRVLQFGPTVHVVSPASFRAEVKKRIDRQVELLADLLPSRPDQP